MLQACRCLLTPMEAICLVASTILLKEKQMSANALTCKLKSDRKFSAYHQ